MPGRPRYVIKRLRLTNSVWVRLQRNINVNLIYYEQFGGDWQMPFKREKQINKWP